MAKQKSILVSVVLCLIVALASACSLPKIEGPTPTAPSETAAAPESTATPAAPVATATQPVQATAASPTAEPAPTAEAEPTRTRSLHMNSPEYGMQAFLWWRPEVASRDLQIISEAGFGWVKVNFGWREIELEKGGFDWSHTDTIVDMASAEGLDIIARVDFQPEWAGGGFPQVGPPDDLQDLGDFLSAVASRYAGRIRAYQVWNEPNLGREWGNQTPDPAQYAEMLKIAYQAIKDADPGAMVISAGLSPTGVSDANTLPDDVYLTRLYEAMNGDSDGYFDVLGAHGAGYLSPPDIDPDTVANTPSLGGHRSMAFRRVEDLRQIMVDNGDQDKQVALLEFGWTSDPRPDSPYHWHAVSEEQKGEYMVAAYQYAREHWSPWIGVMSLIYVCDPDWTEDDEQYWWAITDPSYPEFKPRPAYEALKAMEK
ncbi:MAG: beta-galactosidase [Anaerolineae bacterium]|jgi:hypothetical protein|nr:cellulase family glycosylhydrolase [Chloroflexota bacterium]